MAAVRKQTVLERRLREIDRERNRVRHRIQEVRRWADSVPGGVEALEEWRRRRPDPPPPAAPVEAIPPPLAMGVLEMDAATGPENEIALDFAPGPEGLDTKRVVMPRLQRTDLLRPSIGGHASTPRLAEPEFDRFRSYFGTTGLKRVREARRERGSHRIRAIFMILMVLTLSYILFKMLT